MSSGRYKYFLAAISSAIIWGFVSISLRNIKEFPSEQILYYRIFTSLILTWVFILFFRINKLKWDIASLRQEIAKNRNRLFWLTILSGIFITGNWYAFIYAVNNVSLTSAAFAYMVCPLVTAFGGFFILKETLSKIKLIAIAIAIISIIILAQGSLREVLWSVFIAMFYAAYLMTQRVINSIDKFNLLAVQFIISAILLLPFFIYQHTAFPTSLVFWSNIIFIAIFFTIIPLFLSLYALSGMASSTMGILIYINPIVAFTVAFFYFHEEISLHQAMAYFLLLTAVLIFNTEYIKSLFFKKVDRL